jgi:hypothetical protein
MMIKEARYVDDALNGPIHEPQTIALKATRSKEVLPSKVAQVEVAGLNEEEMALIIKRFKTALRGRKEHPNKNKTKGKHSCFKCGKIGHFIADCPDNDSDQEQEKKREMSPVRLSKNGPGRGLRARPVGRPGMTRNSNGSGWPEIQTIRAFSGLGRAGRPECTPILPRLRTWFTMVLSRLYMACGSSPLLRTNRPSSPSIVSHLVILVTSSPSCAVLRTS